MEKNFLVPRYKVFLEEMIKCYKDEQVSSEEIEYYLSKEFR